MTQKAATKTQISCLHVSQHERSWSGEQGRGGGECVQLGEGWPGAARDAETITKTHTEPVKGGILIDTLQNLELHSFLTQDAFPHLNSTGAGRGNLNI